MIKKIITLVFIFIAFFGVNKVSASGIYTGTGNTCIELKCINNRINELIKINNKLQEENKELTIKYSQFNSSLDDYLKILSTGENITNEKKEAYNIALNNIFDWIKWYGGILSVLIVIIGVGFGLYKQNEIKNSKKEILDDIGEYKKELKDYKEELKKGNKDDIDIMKEKILLTLTEKEIKKEVLEKLEASMLKKIGELFESEKENNKKLIEELIKDEKEIINKIENNNEDIVDEDEVDDAELLDEISGNKNKDKVDEAENSG